MDSNYYEGHKIRNIKISLKTNISNTVKYIESIISSNDVEAVSISALNLAISRAVMIVEIVKSKIKGLHEQISISSLFLNKDGLSEYSTEDDNLKENPKAIHFGTVTVVSFGAYSDVSIVWSGHVRLYRLELTMTVVSIEAHSS